MGSNRTKRRAAERQARREMSQPIGDVEFSGMMGIFQRNMRVVFFFGIVLMVLSLGSIIFITRLGGSSPHGGSGGAATTSDTIDSPSTSDTISSETPAEEDDGIVRQYGAAPELTIDVNAHYEAVIEFESGARVRIELLPAEAPGYVNNFVFLARNQFYDGLTFHRVIPGFVAQGGDPTGVGRGGPGYDLIEEQNDLRFEPGVLSMAKRGTAVNGSQFFITLGAAPHLEGDFTVFGRVTEGLDALTALTARDPSLPDQPEADRIISIEIIEEEA